MARHASIADDDAATHRAAVAAAIAAWIETARMTGIAVSTAGELDDDWATSIVTQRRAEVADVTRFAHAAADAANRARLAEQYEGPARAPVEEAEGNLDGARDRLSRSDPPSPSPGPGGLPASPISFAR